MFLAIDIGNTNVTMGVFEGEKIRYNWRLATDIHKMPDEYAMEIMALLQFRKLAVYDIKEVALCSTVAPLIPIFVKLLDDYFGIKPLVVTAGVKTGVRIRGDNPREVGADRVVNTVAGFKLYGGRRLWSTSARPQPLISFRGTVILSAESLRPAR